MAFANVLAVLKRDVHFPKNVFRGIWSNFLFFDADRIFFGNFIWAVKELLLIERSNDACLLNLSRQSGSEFDLAACICLNASTKTDDYEERLRVGGMANAWLYNIDEDYGCASDVGEWCIYCERQREVAVIAIKSIEMMKMCHVPLRLLGARPAEELWKPEPVRPVSKVGEAWREDLATQYTPSLEKERFRWWADQP